MYKMSVAVLLCLLLLQGYCPGLFSSDVTEYWASEIICPENNRSADLQIQPTENGILPKFVHHLSNKPLALYCCATGYSYVQWYKDGEEIREQDNTHLYAYNNETTREKVLWFALNISDCTYYPSFASYECVFTCEVYSVDGLSSTSHNITVYLFPKDPPVAPVTIPEFVNAEAEDCLVEGQDMHAYCQIQYGEEEPIYPKEIEILLENGTSLVELIDWTKPYESQRIHSHYTNRLFSLVGYNVTVKKITSEFLDQKYTCQSVNTPGVNRSFIVGRCEEPDVRMEEFMAVKVAVPIAAIILLAIIVIILLIRFNVYANMWWKVHVLQRFQSHPESYKYDAYFIYKDITHPTVLNSKDLLEDVFNISLCIPDRDFAIGAMTPELIGDHLGSSKYVVAFLSNDMFGTEHEAMDWSDIAISLALALNKKTAIVLLEDIDSVVVKGRADVRAALKILNCVKIADGDKKLLSQTFSKIFNLTV